MSSNTISFLHTGTIGDIWASLPAVKERHRQTGKKAIFYLVNGQAATYYSGATHPTRSDDGNNIMVMLNKKMVDMIIPLLKAQPYIEDAREYNNEPITINLSAIRDTFVNMPYHSLSRWYFYKFPDLACDLSKQYIEVPETKIDFAKNKIIIGRTERYLNTEINYSFLKPHEDKILFAGTELEHGLFCLRFGLNIKRLIINDFLELAQSLKQCKFLLSNQTQIFQISEGLKTPRVVELCSYAPNVEPIGENAFEFYAQNALEYYFHRLNGTLEGYIKQLKTDIKAKKARNKSG